MCLAAYRTKNGNVIIPYIPVIYEVTTGFEPVVRELQSLALPLGYVTRLSFSDSDGNRTRVTAVKGRCLNLLTTEP